jgi:hypothetical protein
MGRKSKGKSGTVAGNQSPSHRGRMHPHPEALYYSCLQLKKSCGITSRIDVCSNNSFTRSTQGVGSRVSRYLAGLLLDGGPANILK